MTLNNVNNHKRIETKASHSWSFLFVGCWVDLNNKNKLFVLSYKGMKILFAFAILSISFSQRLDSHQSTISQLKLAVENASRNGQVVWAEEFSGLT